MRLKVEDRIVDAAAFARDHEDVARVAAARVADQRVAARAAGQRVLSATAGQKVVARAAVERVVAGIAGDPVVEVRADDVLDPVVGVAVGVAAPAAGRKVEFDPGGRARIARGVDAGPADQRIRAAPADERVVAGAAIERVVAVVAIETVMPRRGRGSCRFAMSR